MKELHEIEVAFDRKCFRQLLKDKKWKNQDLANETGIPVTSICNYSKGVRTPKTSALYKIAIALDVAMEDLLMEI
jgi:transcriptional regulator with XRE-family HTH domain